MIGRDDAQIACEADVDPGGLNFSTLHHANNCDLNGPN